MKLKKNAVSFSQIPISCGIKKIPVDPRNKKKREKRFIDLLFIADPGGCRPATMESPGEGIF
jgi:hypothetical protein